MKNTFGDFVSITLFGESHGPAIGCVLDGFPAGITIDEMRVLYDLAKRRSVASISTARKESDRPEFLSGILNHVTEGTPIAILIRNENAKRSDYDKLRSVPRPSHADYTAEVKYHGYQDASGGGHFSGRLTAPIVAAGSICQQALEQKGIYIATHIRTLYNLRDRAFDEEHLNKDIETIRGSELPVLEESFKEDMLHAIENARSEGDSLGGSLETAVVGLPAGIGEPFFDSLESRISHALFSIPAVKGVAFGDGFDLCAMKGSEANDHFILREGGVATETNHSGGINGGISNGMPVVFTTAVKPTPSISKTQKSVNLETMEETALEITGRHDPAIVHRAAIVVTAMTAIVLMDEVTKRYGEEWWNR